jgi:hypothetical protein
MRRSVLYAGRGKERNQIKKAEATELKRMHIIFMLNMQYILSVQNSADVRTRK